MQLNKLHRIYINDSISINDELKINSDTSNHIKNVLRIRNNSKIVVFNGDGKEYIAEVNYTDNSTILIKHENPSRKDNTHQITLAQCIPSAKHMDLAIQKSVEIGINKIVPVISERSHPGDHKKKYSHCAIKILNTGVNKAQVKDLNWQKNICQKGLFCLTVMD